jgi:hypothetical protein
MSSMRWLILALALGWAAPAYCVDWGLGTHLGLTSIQSDVKHSGSTTVLSWPSSVFAYQPGLRVSCADHERANELILDSGQVWLEEGGSSAHQLSVALGIQHTFWSARRVAPFVNLDLAWYSEGGSTNSATSTAWGGGLGVRHVVGDHHGALRAEVRADHLSDSSTFGRPALTMIALRLGFDLWL